MLKSFISLTAGLLIAGLLAACTTSQPMYGPTTYASVPNQAPSAEVPRSVNDLVGKRLAFKSESMGSGSRVIEFIRNGGGVSGKMLVDSGRGNYNVRGVTMNGSVVQIDIEQPQDCGGSRKMLVRVDLNKLGENRSGSFTGEKSRCRGGNFYESVEAYWAL